MSPCGNGTNSYDHWEMRIHKRVFHIYTSQESMIALLSAVKPEQPIMIEAVNHNEDED